MVWCEFGVKKKNTKKIRQIQVQNLLERFLSNLVCKVMYMVGLNSKIYKFDRINPIVLKLQ